MKRLLLLLLILIISSLIISYSIGNVYAQNLTVGSGGYSTINQAIQAASSGDTISIHAGRYTEQVELNKGVILQPFGDGEVVVDAECSRTYGIRVSASNASIKNLTIKKSVDGGVRIEDISTANTTIEGNKIQDFDCQNQGPEYRAGVSARYPGVGQRIIGNTIIRRVEIGGGLAGGKSDCIWFKANSSNQSGGHYIAGNTISGCWDGIGGETENDPHGTFDRDTIIENNTVSECNDDGIQVEGGDVNIKVRNNRIYRCPVGIASAPNLIGPLYIENNTIIEGRPGHYGNVACFKIGDNGQGTTYYTGNICNVSGDGWTETNDNVNSIVARNNSIKTNRYVIEIATLSSGAKLDFDSDCLYTTDSSRFVKFPGGVRYNSLSEFQSKTGQEKNGTSNSSCGSGSFSAPASNPTSAPLVSIPTKPPTPTTKPLTSPTKTPTPKPISKTPTPTPKYGFKPTIKPTIKLTQIPLPKSTISPTLESTPTLVPTSTSKSTSTIGGPEGSGNFILDLIVWFLKILASFK